MPSIF